jgi:hypothetical protein
MINHLINRYFDCLLIYEFNTNIIILVNELKYLYIYMTTIKNFVIYGERCSGTNFLENVIKTKSKADGSVINYYAVYFPSFK